MTTALGSFGRSTLHWVLTEVRHCDTEIERLGGLDHKSMSVTAALGSSALVAILGNGVVIAGRRFGHDQAITLATVPAIAGAGAWLLGRRGWRWRDLGFRMPAADPPARGARRLVWLAAVVATGFGAGGLGFGDGATRLGVVRQVVGTALGEEAVHRGVVLAVWASTPIRSRWVLAANALTFGLWHVAAATHDSEFRWWEVALPTVGAPLLLWARLRFRSIVAPAVGHAATNLPGIVIGER